MVTPSSWWFVQPFAEALGEPRRCQKFPDFRSIGGTLLSISLPGSLLSISWILTYPVAPWRFRALGSVLPPRNSAVGSPLIAWRFGRGGTGDATGLGTAKLCDWGLRRTLTASNITSVSQVSHNSNNSYWGLIRYRNELGVLPESWGLHHHQYHNLTIQSTMGFLIQSI